MGRVRSAMRAASHAALALLAALDCVVPRRDVVEPVEHSAPLVIAARKNDMATVRALLAATPAPDVNQRTADGTSALHWAVYHNDADLVDRLIAAGADVKAQNDYGATPMSEAAVVGNVKVLRKLLAAGADVESAECGWPDRADDHRAHEQRRSGEAAASAQRAKVNAREQWRGQTPLMWAAAEAQPAMVKLLIKHGADVNARSNVNEWERQVTAEPRMQARPSGGFTPLLYAARKGCAECAQHSAEGRRGQESRRPGWRHAAAARDAEFQFRLAAFLVKQART